MKKRFLFFVGFAFLIFNIQAQTVTDYDSNVYNTVTIGSQTWMKENLKVTHYRNGDSMQNITDNSSWICCYPTIGEYCNYNNDTNNVSSYGRIYNWYAVTDTNCLCPLGWHVPSDTEFTILSNYLGGENIAGGKMKEIGTSNWNTPNSGATNESGFTALPGGYRNWSDGSFMGMGLYAYFWSSSDFNNGSTTWNRILLYNGTGIVRGTNWKITGSSVRCLRDSAAQINYYNNNNNIQIYPNPAIDRVYIKCLERLDLKMQVYNVVGEIVLQRELSSGTNDIDISSLSKGIYVIKITSANWTAQHKLTKE